MLKRILIALTIIGSLMVATVAVAAATDSAARPEASIPLQVQDEDARDTGFEEPDSDDAGATDTDQRPTDDTDFDDAGFVIWGDDELTPELIDEINADTAALVDHLTGLGFEVTVETDESGLQELVFDEHDDAIWQAIEDFEKARFAAEVDTWSDAEQAEWNAGIDELVAELAELGITVETTEIAPGVRDVVWTEALEAELDEHWDEECDVMVIDDLELNEAEIDEINADTAALFDHLTGLGFEVTVETDESGLQELVFDEHDDAIWQAIEDFEKARFAAEVDTWSDAEKAEWNAEIDEH